jgi:hypothetical protein
MMENYLPLSGINRLLSILQPATLPAELSWLTSFGNEVLCPISYVMHTTDSKQNIYVNTTLLTGENIYFYVSTVLIVWQHSTSQTRASVISCGM